MGAAGHLYGTTAYGGAHLGGDGSHAGTVFELTPNAAKTKWTEAVLYNFCTLKNCVDGEQPGVGLILHATGHLYGTTAYGGAHFDAGTAFELTPNAAKTNWTETVLYSFCAHQTATPDGRSCADGAWPFAGLIMDASGHLYGTTSYGGGHLFYGGTVFALTPNTAKTTWTETVLYSFCAKGGGYCTDGEEPSAGLIVDRSGHLFGTTGGGGALGVGTVFELTPNEARTKWTETVLHSFCTQTDCADGAFPGGLIMDAARRLYDTAAEGGYPDPFGETAGTVFTLIPNAAKTKWIETVLYSFCAHGVTNCADGEQPGASLIMDAAGHLYGTTAAGGSHGFTQYGYPVGGTVFELP